MRATLIITVKDLRLRIRDGSALIVGVVAPFSLAVVLHLVLGGLDPEEFSARFGLIDQDESELSEQFVRGLEQLAGDVTVSSGLSEREARAKIRRGDLDAAFVIPDGFWTSALSEEPTKTLEVLPNTDQPLATEIANAVARGFVDRLNGLRLAAMTAQPDDAVPDAAMVEAASREPLPVTVRQSVSTPRQLDTATYAMAGISVFFVFFVAQFGVRGLLDERQAGTMARLLAAPIPRLAIPAAKALTSVVLGVVALLVLATASTALLGADWGDRLTTVLLILAVTLAAVSIMGLIAGVASTPEQAGDAQALVALVLGLVGGSFFPVSRGGALLGWLSILTPHQWFLRGLGEGRAGGLGSAVGPVVALLLFSVVVGSASALVLARKTTA